MRDCVGIGVGILAVGALVPYVYSIQTVKDVIYPLSKMKTGLAGASEIDCRQPI